MMPGPEKLMYDIMRMHVKLPGFYVDVTDSICIVLNKRRIAIFVSDGKYNVTVDQIDENGDFAKNMSWSTFKDVAVAVTELKNQVKTANSL